MFKNASAFACLVGLIAVPAAALAQAPRDSAAPEAAPQPKPAAIAAEQLQKPAATEAADINTVGDFFKFNVKVEHFRPSDAAGPEVTAPQDSCFRVSQELEQSDPANPSKAKKIARGKFETGWFPRLLLPPYKCESSLPFDAALSYDVPRQMILEDRDRERFGWTYGALVTPFKFYTKDREFSAGASVGPYLGYRLHDRQGSSSVLALAIGAATANVTTNNADGSSSNSNATGLTVGLAYLLDVKGAFNVGFIAGSDFFSKSQHIPTSNKLWLGLSFGYRVD